MVFYFLAYRGAIKHSREVAYIAVGKNHVRRNDIEDIDDIFRRKAIRIKSVKFRGWCLSPIATKPDDNPDRPVRHEETLAETLARMRCNETLDDAMKRGASVRYVNKAEAKEEEEASKPYRAYISRKQKVKKNKKVRKVAKDLYNDQIDEGSSSGYGDESSFDEGMMEEPQFSRITPSSSMSNRTVVGCMRVKTLQESLAHTNLKSVGNTNNNSGQSNQSNTPKVGTMTGKSVHYGTVDIRQYSRCLGDNPVCSSGPPVSIGWKYRRLAPVPLDQYEEESGQDAKQEKGGNDVSFASSNNLKGQAWTLSSEQRQQMLLSLGYSLREIMDAERRIKDCQRQRYETIYHLNSYQYKVFGERMENMRQCFRRLSTFTTAAA